MSLASSGTGEDAGLPASGALPVSGVLAELEATLAEHGTALLVAPPGTGKTTLVPLALAGLWPVAAARGPARPGRVGRVGRVGRIVVAEPRRVAVRAAARRMASMLGQDVGAQVGFSVRGERRTSPATRVEVVTTGLLLRRLQADPELTGVSTLVLDEVHERHLDADLALAFAVDVRAALRPDLRLLAASATPDVARITAALAAGAGSAPVVTASAPAGVLDVVWAPPGRPVRPPEGLWVDPALLDHAAAVVRRALAERAGDVLVFLPGAGEIAGVRSRLASLRTGAEDVDVLALSGSQSTAEQDAALSLGPRRRVVLATAVAESSLTVPGVRVVVDAGLARAPRTDHARGLSGLATLRLSRASAQQRAGRAAREGPGTVYRCWTEREHSQLAAHTEPEIAVADLTGAVLALALWSSPDGAGLHLPDAPPAGALAAAVEVLRRLGLMDPAGRVTDAGRRVAALGLEPRWGRALLDGAAVVGVRRASEVVAVLSDDGVTPRGSDDLVASWRALRRGDDPARSARWRAEVSRVSSALRPGGGSGGIGRSGDDHPDDRSAAVVVALAHPERLARARPGGSSYLTAGGTGAELSLGSALTGAPWLAIAGADRSPGRAQARVRSAVVLDETGARELGADQLVTVDEVTWAQGDVRARQVERLGAIELCERSMSRPPTLALAQALAAGLREEGLALLRWSDGAIRLRQRMAACHLALGAPWPEVSDEALLADASAWLGAGLANARSRADMARIDVVAALRGMLPWPEAAHLDALAPERLALPGGGTARLDWADPPAPVVAVRLQQVLGWQGAPRVLGGRVAVVVHLLSPAGRPLAVTADLASFWRGPYRDVRAQMRGRYPKHAWPEDPLAP